MFCERLNVGCAWSGPGLFRSGPVCMVPVHVHVPGMGEGFYWHPYIRA